MIKEYKPTSLETKDPFFEKVPWINEQSIDYRLLRNNDFKYFYFDVWSSTWSAWDATFRVVKLIGKHGDREEQYSQEIITSLGSTTAKITRWGTMFVQGDSFILPAWKVLEVFAYFSTSTQNLEIRLTGSSYRRIRWSNNTLTSTNDNVAVVNSWQTDIVVDLRFATSAAERPVFWSFFKIF